MGRTKQEAQDELEKRFGIRKTSNFQDALNNGKIKNAQEWLQYIVDNKIAFPQYKMSWDSWLSDRENELANAKNKLSLI